MRYLFIVNVTVVHTMLFEDLLKHRTTGYQLNVRHLGKQIELASAAEIEAEIARRERNSRDNYYLNLRYRGYL